MPYTFLQTDYIDLNGIERQYANAKKEFECRLEKYYANELSVDEMAYVREEIKHREKMHEVLEALLEVSRTREYEEDR